MKHSPATPYEALLLSSAIEILKSDPRKDEWSVNTPSDNLDTQVRACSNQGSQVLNPVDTTITQELTMAKSKPSAAKAAESTATAESGTPEANTVIKHEDGSTETLNPTPVKEPTKQELKAAEAQARIAAKAAKQEAAAKAKAEREAAKAEKEALKGATAEQRAAAKAAREARMAELAASGRKYVGSMLALSDRVKEGQYVKSATGQLRSNDELAIALDGVTPNGVIQTAKAVLTLEANPYSHLNVGQQSMNLRNKMRGAIRKGLLSIEAVRDYVKANDLDVSADVKAKAEAKAARQAELKAEREAKAAAAAAAKAAKAKAEPEAQPA